ncbi:MAG TPA: Na+/H+ antiporter NhaA [Methylomirabilota bacterium]|jgi:NhaA family Na+:H+ antiporter|nr:Na+/H+ antiporter NhaA [Methylomirabilota bacterium]
MTGWHILRAAVEFVLDPSLLIVVGAAGGLVWANAAPASYAAVSHALHFPVNDVGMVFFFGLAMKEVVEAVLPGGPLESPRRAAMPLLAAMGGMLAPAVIHVGLSLWLSQRELAHGWAIPCATDIAFSYLVSRLIFGAQHPAIPFLLLLAIADDALGLVILAVFYPAGETRLGECVAILAGAILVSWLLRRRSVANFWAYILLAGTVSWTALFRGGLHPALALVPVIPFIPHEERDRGILCPQERGATDPLNRFAQWWHVPVQVILFFFALVNAGVPVSSVGAGTWVVLAGLIIGKPVGILLVTAAGVLGGLRRPSGVTWADMSIVGLAAGIGFTVSLFFATAAFPGEIRLLSETKMGALLSFGSGGIAVALAVVLKVGRFGRERYLSMPG